MTPAKKMTGNCINAYALNPMVRLATIIIAAMAALVKITLLFWRLLILGGGIGKIQEIKMQGPNTKERKDF